MAISLDSVFNNTQGAINKNVGSMNDWINNQKIPRLSRRRCCACSLRCSACRS